MKIKSARSLIAAGAFSFIAAQAVAMPTEFYFEQQAGFDASSFSTTKPLTLTHNFTNALPNGAGGYPAGTFSDLDWEFGNGPGGDEGDPSALNITTFNDGAVGDALGGVSPSSGDGTFDTNTDGLWSAGEWWTITRLTQTNNVIDGNGTPLWTMDAVANLEIFSDAAHTDLVLGDFDSVTALEFNETANDGTCNPNETGTNCEDFYLAALTDFAPEMFTFDGMQYQVFFRVIPIQNAIVDIIGDQLRVITREDAPGTSIIDIQMAWRKVPAPATLALLGLGLAGLGAFSRRKQKNS